MPEVILDFSFLEKFATFTPWQSFWYVFSHGGWAIMLFGLVKGLWMYWNFYILNHYADRVRYTMLAIDVPKNNEQGPLAVENIFSHFAGVHGTETKWERYWHGRHQLALSLEIVSIDGYIQFIVRTPEKYRDLVEAAIYAQYPDAEITEIEDYVKQVPQHWPHPEYKFFGLEYKLHRPEAYPIRTWQEFEDKLLGEFKDPMAALLEIMGKISPGEQIWIQYVLTPINDDWKAGGEKLVNKLISRKEKHKETFAGKISSIPFALLSMALSFVHDILFGAVEGGESGGDEGPPTMMMHMSPGEKDVVAAIQHKISKIGFRVKCRIMYIARNEVYHTARGSNAVIGAMKQFNSVELNRFAIQKKIWTKAYYVFTKYRIAERQNKLMRAYRVRSDARGAGPGFVLNIEELATLWHFPVMQVKAPLVRKTEAKRAEPPFSLPVSVPRIFRSKKETVPPLPVTESIVPPLAETVKPVSRKEEKITPAPEEPQKKEEPPENLPFV